MVLAGKPHENTRLDSWKAIAAYLGRDVSTVIRWEKEKGLPVHRLPGGKRQAVFAWTGEIDAWLLGHPEPATTEPAVPASEPAAEDGRLALVLAITLGVYAVVQLWNVLRVEFWLRHRRVESPPDISGVWGEVVTIISRIYRRKQFHRARVTALLRELAETMCRAYGQPAEPLTSWWMGRLPKRP